MRNITNTLNQQKISEILEDYQLDFSMFTDLDDRLLEIQDKWEKLELPYRIVMILYAEFGSLRKVASILGFSHTTIAKEIALIRKKLC